MITILFLSVILVVCQMTCTFLPWNFIVPLEVAKRVKSLPIETLVPGKNFVPHWRTIIEPAFASCPAKSLTPLNFGLLSLPFLEEPCPFLCAIAKIL